MPNFCTSRRDDGIYRCLVTEKTNLNPAEVGDIVVGSVLGVGSQRSSECRMAAFYAGFPVLKAVTEKTNLNPAEVGDIVVGSVLGVGSQRSSECRMAAFYAGFPAADVPAAIKVGFYDIGIGAGLESMTANPMAWDGSVNPRVKTIAQAQDCLLPMGITSENVSQRFGVTRKEQDQALVDSNRKAAAATAFGKFKDEIIRVKTKVDSNRKAAAATAFGKFKDEIIRVKTKIVDPKTGDEKPVTISFDHGVRSGTTLADLAKLEPVFKKDGSTTAGFTDETTSDYQCNLGPDGRQGTLMNGLIYAPQGNSWFM
ncbi:Chain A, Peroxisomal 3-Ketoacyl-Coa Thiolase [Artemisia annua]|uniref:Chain A, Peroxisomal 3-Ketoacyl-Coa Thiolase n=1 Tax=Artemisia annua TaxID=35608 RepID=A0A2U1KLX0_ARTAN|nr:Chain A, Peroxisomal 3-Ketoacyl-Coa Thiolase [Artemisia annua]